MTGNPSSFVVNSELTNYQTTASMTGYVPMSAVSALIDVVQTYSGKWLLNGDL